MVGGGVLNAIRGWKIGSRRLRWATHAAKIGFRTLRWATHAAKISSGKPRWAMPTGKIGSRKLRIASRALPKTGRERSGRDAAW